MRTVTLRFKTSLVSACVASAPPAWQLSGASMPSMRITTGSASAAVFSHSVSPSTMRLTWPVSSVGSGGGVSFFALVAA